jgi:hypothetical protein
LRKLKNGVIPKITFGKTPPPDLRIKGWIELLIDQFVGKEIWS